MILMNSSESQGFILFCGLKNNFWTNPHYLCHCRTLFGYVFGFHYLCGLIRQG
jgi:hypothetical protein